MSIPPFLRAAETLAEHEGIDFVLTPFHSSDPPALYDFAVREADANKMKAILDLQKVYTYETTPDMNLFKSSTTEPIVLFRETR
jgi:hypothetical protein